MNTADPTITRRHFIRRAAGGLGALALGSPLLSTACRPSPEQPNIVLIFIDDMGWTGLSEYGNPHVQTPNIDRLAAEGMKFTQAYAAPMCSPSRAGLLSGLYPGRIGITRALPGRDVKERAAWKKLQTPMPAPRLPVETFSLGEALQERGYTTALLGKWHLGTEDGGSGYHIKHSHEIEYIRRHFGFDTMDPGADLDVDKGVTDLTDKAVTFLEGNRERPFFLYLSHHSVHTYCAAPEAIVEKYLGQGVMPTGKYPYEGINSATYRAMIEHLDTETGRLLDALDRLELMDDTLVLFVSDNGGPVRVTRNDPLRRGKATCYEGGVRVPMIARRPGRIPPGRTCDVPVHLIDIFPTLLDATGGKPQKDQTLDGESLLPLLTGEKTALERDALFFHIPHYICYSTGHFRTTPHGAVIQGKYKLVEHFSDYFSFPPDANRDNAIYDPNLSEYVPERRVELFDLENDIGERVNLAERMPEKAAELLDRLRRWREEVGASMPVPNPDYDPEARFVSEFDSSRVIKR